MKYQRVYEIVRQNMADPSDFPDDDELIFAALEAAKEAVRNSRYFGEFVNKAWQEDILAAIDALGGKHAQDCGRYCPWPDTDWIAPGARLPKCHGGDCTLCDEVPCTCYVENSHAG